MMIARGRAVLGASPDNYRGFDYYIINILKYSYMYMTCTRTFRYEYAKFSYMYPDGINLVIYIPRIEYTGTHFIRAVMTG